MQTTAKWPWSRSLALTRDGSTVQVDTILFGSVQDLCSDLGVRPGAVLTCENQEQTGVRVRLASGSEVQIPRHYAWFVSVNPL